MRSPVTGIVALILLFVAAITAYSSFFTVRQTEQALVGTPTGPNDSSC
jgi:membrane protease subunit HflC